MDEKIKSQAVIGYQRRHDGALATVWRDELSTGRVTFAIVYTDAHGYQRVQPSSQPPRVDIPQRPS